MGTTTELLQGTLDLLHVQQGSLYPALDRLEHPGLTASGWGESENNRKGLVLAAEPGDVSRFSPVCGRSSRRYSAVGASSAT
jgi:hypothetical protein